MNNFYNYKKFENVGIRRSNDTLIAMDSTNNNISLHSSDGGDDNVNTLSIKNIINKTPNEDLILSSINGTTINPVITINNNNQDCRINTNLTVDGTVTANTFSGNAATATKLATARSIGGVSFDGTTNITLPGVNAYGTQGTSGTANYAHNAGTSGTANYAHNAGNAGNASKLDGNYSSAFALSAHSHSNYVTHTATETLSNKSLTSCGNISGTGYISGEKIYAKRLLRCMAPSDEHCAIESRVDTYGYWAYLQLSCWYCNAGYHLKPYIRHESLSSSGMSSNIAISGSSDDRIKIDEELILDATNTILKLRPQKYKKFPTKTISEAEELIKKKATCYIIESGLIAQEMFYEVPELRFLISDTVDPNLVDETPRNFDDIKNDPDYSNWSNEVSSVNYIGLIPYLIRGFQEQHVEIETLDRHQIADKGRIANLETKVNILETENQQQQTKINTLETDVSTLKTDNVELKSIIDKLKKANSFEEFKQTF